MSMRKETPLFFSLALAVGLSGAACKFKAVESGVSALESPQNIDQGLEKDQVLELDSYLYRSELYGKSISTVDVLPDGIWYVVPDPEFGKIYGIKHNQSGVEIKISRALFPFKESFPFDNRALAYLLNLDNKELREMENIKLESLVDRIWFERQFGSQALLLTNQMRLTDQFAYFSFPYPVPNGSYWVFRMRDELFPERLEELDSQGGFQLRSAIHFTSQPRGLN